MAVGVFVEFYSRPGEPEVIEYLVKVIKDIVTKYNVDGIVFDDYFYPYEGTKNEDAYSQSLYKPEGKNVGDWRRENCNKLIADIYAMIQETKSDREIRYRAFRDMGR